MLPTVAPEAHDDGSRDKTPMAKCHCPKPQYKKCSPQPQNPKPQTHESVAFHTLAFCLWHSDRIPDDALPTFFEVKKKRAGLNLSVTFLYLEVHEHGSRGKV